MDQKLEIEIEVDDQGRLVLPSEIVSRFKLKPGTKVSFEDNGNGFRVHAGTPSPQKIYVEPTNQCNLECRTCMRQSWDEPLGEMTRRTFARLLDGLRGFSPVPRVFFGGIGEPLAHPDIVDIVARVKALGAEIELITNGTLLSREMSRRLLQAGLDMLWVSIDGATPESYTDVRLGAALPEVLANLDAFCRLRQTEYTQRAQVGIAFVAMKRNIADLPELLRIAKNLGAKRFMVSNVLPYTPGMEKEILYARSRLDFFYGPFLELPVMDVDGATLPALCRGMEEGKSIALRSARPNDGKGHCPFVQGSSATIGWEGVLSPCPPLLHTHESFVDGRRRISRRYPVGNVNERSLQELWDDTEYTAFRRRVEEFNFSPCAVCGGCEWGEGNQEDCFGNGFPTCGGCVWAQGVIQCP